MTTVNWEHLNQFGPWTIAPWRDQSNVVGDEESNSGRAEALRDLLFESISNWCKQTGKPPSSLKVIDIAAYDGWLLNQVKREFNVSLIVGIEPRVKNINKGIAIREALGIADDIHYICSTIQNYKPQEMFDVVLCTGLLYHVESLQDIFGKITSLTNGLLFLESRVTSKTFDKAAAQEDIEANDLAYKVGFTNLIGSSMSKFETSYSDGSSYSNTIVTIPSIDLLRMYLRINGFTNIEILADQIRLDSMMKRKEKKLKGAVISATRNSADSFLSNTSNFAIPLEKMAINVVLSGQTCNTLRGYLEGNASIKTLMLTQAFKSRNLNNNLVKVLYLKLFGAQGP